MMSAEWKNRQFVPDSDDDNEEESLDIGAHEDEASVSNDDSSWRVLHKSQAQENELPLQSDEIFDPPKIQSQSPDHESIETVFHEGLEPEDQSSRKYATAFSNTSSALSSIASTPLGLSPRSPRILVEPAFNNPSDVLPERAEADQIFSQINRTSRQFRERKAIQLNPYAIEGQLYKQIWKSRGLVPLRVKNQGQEEAERDADVSSSEIGNDSQSVDGSSPVRDRCLESEFALDLNSDLSLDLIHDEFPDLQSVLRPPPKDSLIKGPKRRKIAHTYSRKKKSQSASTSPSKIFQIREDGWVEVPYPHGEDALQPKLVPKEVKGLTASSNKATTIENQKLACPPSPFRTSPSLPHTSPILFFEDNDSIAPFQLQTPVTSSEAQVQLSTHRQEIDATAPTAWHSETWVLSDTESSAGLEEEEVEEEEVEEEEAVEAAEEEAIRQLARAQRRTRGVLPASWHRLEYQKSLKINEHSSLRQLQYAQNHPSGSLSPVKARKGIAKRIKRMKLLAPDDTDSRNAIALDSEPEVEDHSIQKRQHVVNQPHINDFFMTKDASTFSYDDENDTDMEDDKIDTMTGRGKLDHTGHARRHREGRKRQKRLGYEAHVQPQRLVHENPNISNRRKALSKHTPKSKKSSNTKQPKQLIGILDVTQNLQRAEIPRFLAYATRTARHRKDHAKHSPTRKHIHLHKKKETYDAQASLRDWSQVVEHKRNHSFSSRQPLHERTANHTRFQVSISDDETDEQENQARTLAPPRMLEAKTQNNPSAFRKETLSKPNQAAKHKQPMQRGHPITSAIRPSHQHAPAQLEAENSIQKHRHVGQSDRKLVLSRFLRIKPTQHTSSPSRSVTSKSKEQIRLEPRKRLPRQLSLALCTEVESCSGDVEITHSLPPQDISHPSHLGRGFALHLLPCGVEYTTTFDIERLPDGSHFGPDTLIGSGLFAQSLMTGNSNDNQDPLNIVVHSSPMLWNAWNESVAQRIFDICDNAFRWVMDTERGSTQYSSSSEDLTESLSLLKLVIRYLSGHLRFLDPIDRKDFVKQWLSKLYKYCNCLDIATRQDLTRPRDVTAFGQVACHITIISDQVRQIADHETIDNDIKKSTLAVLTLILEKTLQATFDTSFEVFRLFSHNTVQFSDYPHRDQSRSKTEIFVVVSHLVQELNNPTKTIWDILGQQSLLEAPQDKTFASLERIWKRLFCLLPLLEINVTGNMFKRISNTTTVQNWKLVKSLMDVVFQAYSTVDLQSTLERYCRALYARCFRLINHWNWGDCESVMGFLFDFFAQNGLRDLKLETSKGSPAFLGNLTSTTTLDIRDSDRCFHVLLKVIGQGLRILRTKSPGRKIGNCIWRLTPNHDRRLPKDQVLRQEDLNAVQNHLDLLAVLYWAAPADHRIRVEAIRKVIDIEDSHKDVCHIVVRTWSNLVNFQLSTQESADKLDPFVEWFNEIMSKTIKLHRLARSEVEADARVAKISYGRHFSKDQQERIILESQRHIDAILIDALSSLEKAITRMENAAVNLRKLLPDCLAAVFELFDVAQPRTNLIMAQLLNTIQAWTARALESHDAEDSQGYGDWAGMAELLPEMEVSRPITLPNVLDRGFHDFVSTLFGADLTVEDELLQKSLDCWLQALSLEVKANHLTWDDLIDPYGLKSWTILRDTSQRRKYSPLFFSRLITYDTNTYDRNKAMLLRTWFGGLVERGSLIKYQPQFTACLMNRDSTEPLLQNLPFSREDGIYNIGLSDFLERRLSLISCVLSNMRESLSFSTYHQLQDREQRRRNYSELLQHLMSTMKDNYQNLGRGTDLRGDYVALVQRVIQLLQEHTSDICKVDGFFLDAVNIPLPADDPEYLGSKLKSLAMQLHHNGSPQQLAAFIQSLCERAIIEGKQVYFASILTQAMQDAFETGQETQITLRFFICCYMLPMYIQFVRGTSCGWAIAETLLLSMPSTLESLLFHVNVFDSPSVNGMQLIVTSIMDNIYISMNGILNTQFMHDYGMIDILTQYFAVIEATLDAADYVCRYFPDQDEQLVALTTYFANSAYHLWNSIQNIDSDSHPLAAPDLSAMPTFAPPDRFSSTRKFIQESLHGSLDSSSQKCKWRLDDNVLYVHRNGRWEPVKSDLNNSLIKQQDLMAASKSFLRKLRNLPFFGCILSNARWKIDETSILMHGIADQSQNQDLTYFY